MRLLRVGVLLTFLFALAAGWADSTSPAWFSVDENKQVKLRVDLFLSSTCSHCQKADKFFQDLESKKPWLDVHRYFINEDKSSLEAFNQYLLKDNSDDFSVPAIFFCDTRWVGFPEEGAPILKGMNYCLEQIKKTGKLTPVTVQALNQMSTANWYEQNLISKPSTPVFILMMAVMDALSPAAVFSILVLYTFLIVQRQRKIQLGTIIMFLLAAGYIHHIQQVHPTLFYYLLSMARIPAIVIGFLLLGYVGLFHHQGAAPKRPMAIMTVSIVFLTTFIVQMYQQTYSPNFSLIFHQWLLGQNFSPNTQITFAFCYLITYLLMITVIAMGLVGMSRYYGKWSKHEFVVGEFAWHSLIIISLILIAYPKLLALVPFSFMVIILALGSSWICYKFWSKIQRPKK